MLSPKVSLPTASTTSRRRFSRFTGVVAWALVPISTGLRTKPFSHATTSSGPPSAAVGSAKNAPMLARTHSGSYKSAPWPVIIRPLAPMASAERMMLPRLPGFCGRSKAM